MSEKPNRLICAEFRALLTTGFYAVDTDGVILEGADHENALAGTKPWRGEMWKMFRELEDRLCPVQARERAARMGQ